MSKMTKGQEIEALRQIMASAARARAFAAGDFWRKDLEPYLAKEQGDARDGCLWAPSSAVQGVDQIAMRVAYLSGASAAIERIVKRLDFLMQRGDEAAKELERYEKEAGDAKQDS